jgi:hypothetical protein
VTHRAGRRRAATAASTTRAAGVRGILASLTATARRLLALRYHKTTRFASAKVLVFASTKVLTVVLEYIAFGRALARVPRRYQVYLLYHYQFTCFTTTKVQILTQLRVDAEYPATYGSGWNGDASVPQNGLFKAAGAMPSLRAMAAAQVLKCL